MKLTLCASGQPKLQPELYFNHWTAPGRGWTQILNPVICTIWWKHELNQSRTNKQRLQFFLHAVLLKWDDIYCLVKAIIFKAKEETFYTFIWFLLQGKEHYMWTDHSWSQRVAEIMGRVSTWVHPENLTSPNNLSEKLLHRVRFCLHNQLTLYHAMLLTILWAV